MQKAPVVIPQIGRVLGQPIGYATEEDFIKKLGAPTRSVGGHPNGRCTWVDLTNKIEITIDGFEWARNGMLVDYIEIGPSRSRNGIAKVRRKLSLGDYKLCGGSIVLGMKRVSALKVARKKGWKFSKGQDSIRFSAPGNVDFRGVCSNKYYVAYNWETTLEFTHDKLSGINLRVDYKDSP